ncbi:hypothetical protein CW304_22940 [Bacillus sp. UFRGS-B20]|nr:hypothetical protein CW304_22940 [Bacillus sp. UFRGS-B20]
MRSFSLHSIYFSSFNCFKIQLFKLLLLYNRIFGKFALYFITFFKRIFDKTAHLQGGLFILIRRKNSGSVRTRTHPM